MIGIVWVEHPRMRIRQLIRSAGRPVRCRVRAAVPISGTVEMSSVSIIIIRIRRFARVDTGVGLEHCITGAAGLTHVTAAAIHVAMVAMATDAVG